MRHYLDHASATPLRPAARKAMAEWLELSATPAGAGDPARVHEEGRIAREAVELAREQVAALAGVRPRQVVFTASATEAVNTAVASARDGSVMLASAVEHSSVRAASARHGRTVEVAVTSDGTVDLDDLSACLLRLESDAAPMVHCQLANHEIGTVQPVAEVAALCRSRGALLHVDAAAGFGHLAIDLSALGAPFASVSSRKLGGPPGVGALLLGPGVRLSPLVVGGSEERGRRAGGENVIGVVGFGAAAAELCETGRIETEAARASAQRDALEKAAVAAGGVRPLGPANSSRRLPHLLGLSVDGVLGEAVLLALDREGVAVHSGSACSSESLEPSPVIEAIGSDPDRSLRLSVGWSTSDEDIEAFAAVFGEVLSRLRALSAS